VQKEGKLFLTLAVIAVVNLTDNQPKSAISVIAPQAIQATITTSAIPLLYKIILEKLDNI
jgi:hypothetical protein